MGNLYGSKIQRGTSLLSLPQDEVYKHYAAVKAKISAANATIPLKVRAKIDRNEGNMPNPEGGNKNPKGPNIKMILNQTANPFAWQTQERLTTIDRVRQLVELYHL